MKAVVYDRYGPPEVLRVADVERPVPADDQVLVRVHATTLTRTDCGWRSATPFFVRSFVGRAPTEAADPGNGVRRRGRSRRRGGYRVRGR